MVASRGAEVQRCRGERTCTNLSAAPLPTSTQQFWVGELLEEKNIKQVKVLVQRYGAPQTITLRVFSQQGNLIATSDPKLDSQVKDWSQVPGIREALQNHVKQGIAKGILSNSDRLYIARPIDRNGQLLGVIRMSMTLEQFQRQFARVIWSILGTLAITILLCALISSRFARSLSKLNYLGAVSSTYEIQPSRLTFLKR